MSETSNQAPSPATPIMDAADVADSAALRQVTVLIDRDANTRIPAVVLGYEVPAMIEIYGEDRVFVIEEADFDDDDFDVEKAYDGLKTKYRKHEAALRQTYRSLGDFARVIGVKAPSGVTTSTRDKQSMQKDRKKATKKTAKR